MTQGTREMCDPEGNGRKSLGRNMVVDVVRFVVIHGYSRGEGPMCH